LAGNKKTVGGGPTIKEGERNKFYCMRDGIGKGVSKQCSLVQESWKGKKKEEGRQGKKGQEGKGAKEEEKTTRVSSGWKMTNDNRCLGTGSIGVAKSVLS